jgi:hypothetical protein
MAWQGRVAIIAMMLVQWVAELPAERGRYECPVTANGELDWCEKGTDFRVGLALRQLATNRGQTLD